MNYEPLPNVENFLRDKLKNEPADWDTRRRLAHVLYDKGDFEEAALVIWNAEQIPSTDLELAFAARVLAKAQPRRAIRLLTAILENNRGKAVQNMGMANALLHHGMVLQAARFYGAALEADPTLANPDLEHFVLWTDDQCKIWGDFSEHKPKLGDLPWMVRDPKEALSLTSRITLHTTPIHVPSLAAVAGEEIRQQLYQQEAKLNAKITPPPAVTIPINRVDPKDRLYDQNYGAQVTSEPSPADLPASNETFSQKARVIKIGAPAVPQATFPKVIGSSDSPSDQLAVTKPPIPTVIPTRPMAVASPAAIPTTKPAVIPKPVTTPVLAPAPITKVMPPQAIKLPPAQNPPAIPPRTTSPLVPGPRTTASLTPKPAMPAPAPTRRLIAPALTDKKPNTLPLKLKTKDGQ